MSQFNAGPDTVRWRRIAIGLGVLFVLALAVLLVVTLGGGDEGDPSATPTATPSDVRTSAPAQIRTSADAQTSEPEPTSTPDDEPVADDIMVMELLGIELPVSASDGPANIGDGLASGFARTERGAALAAVHISLRTGAFTGPGIYGPTIGEQVVGDAAEQMRTRVDAQYNQDRREAGVESGEPVFTDCSEATGCTTTLGYFISTDEGDEKVVHLLVEALDVPPGSAKLFNSRLTVRWADGDWRLVAPPGGSYASLVSEADADSLDNYTSFGRNS